MAPDNWLNTRDREEKSMAPVKPTTVTNSSAPFSTPLNTHSTAKTKDTSLANSDSHGQGNLPTGKTYVSSFTKKALDKDDKLHGQDPSGSTNQSNVIAGNKITNQTNNDEHPRQWYINSLKERLPKMTDLEVEEQHQGITKAMTGAKDLPPELTKSFTPSSEEWTLIRQELQKRGLRASSPQDIQGGANRTQAVNNGTQITKPKSNQDQQNSQQQTNSQGQSNVQGNQAAMGPGGSGQATNTPNNSNQNQDPFKTLKDNWPSILAGTLGGAALISGGSKTALTALANSVIGPASSLFGGPNYFNGPVQG
jgi:hypothetical protein